MPLKGAISLLVALSLLAGCGATQRRKEAFNAEMNGWIGKHTDDLFIKKGPPTNTATLSDGGKVLEYSKSQVLTSGGGSYTVMVPHFNPVTGQNSMIPQQRTSPVSSRVHDCKILIKVSPESRVESWSADGKGCY